MFSLDPSPNATTTAITKYTASLMPIVARKPSSRISSRLDSRTELARIPAEPDQGSRPQGPVIASVSPSTWMFRNSVVPSGEKHAPASSDWLNALRPSL